MQVEQKEVQIHRRRSCRACSNKHRSSGRASGCRQQHNELAVVRPRRRPKRKAEDEGIHESWLPTGVLLEIFARLPYEDIARLRLLSKSWYAHLHSRLFFQVLLQQKRIDSSALTSYIMVTCVRCSCRWMSTDENDMFSLEVFFPPLHGWLPLPLEPALEAQLGYGLSNVKFSNHRFVPANFWRSQASNGLMCCVVKNSQNRFDEMKRILVFNYLTGAFIAHIDFPPEYVTYMASEPQRTDRHRSVELRLKMFPDPSHSEDYFILVTDAASVFYTIPDLTYDRVHVYSSRIGEWRSMKSVRSAHTINSETDCFENADLLYVEECGIFAYYLAFDEWFSGFVDMYDEISICGAHIFLWKGNVYLADSLVDLGYGDSETDEDYDGGTATVDDVRGFKVCQLRYGLFEFEDEDIDYQLYWHELSRTPDHLLGSFQNAKGVEGVENLNISFVNNGNQVCMAGYHYPHLPLQTYSEHFCAWDTVVYDMETESWSLLPALKNGRRIMEFVSV